MISNAILELIRQHLVDKISVITPVNGGSINRAFCLEMSSGKYFIKTNNNRKFPGMFEAEAAGLNRIAESDTIKT
jgi:protein-ribulosamine 3-kinase